MKARKCLIAGNWKMNKTSSEAFSLVEEINSEAGLQTDVNIVICPPFTALDTVAKVLENSNIQLGAQDVHPEPEGAYTGEISAQMLRDLFCIYVIVGHSERRQYFHEHDNFINQKVCTALKNNLKPILCVGETLQEREQNKTLDIIQKQVLNGLAGVEIEDGDNLPVIAYEPVWAIGTGKTATPGMAQEVHHKIRNILAARYTETIADRIRILYGGSMNPENASELLDQPDIDGGLIGGASLQARPFVELIKIAANKEIS
jgi:triosephosphate isomerase (TIM)